MLRSCGGQSRGYKTMHNRNQFSIIEQFKVLWGMDSNRAQVLCKVSTWAALLCCTCRCVYICARLQNTGSAVYQARANPIKHAALYSPTLVWVREVHISHIHNKRPILPLYASFTRAIYHRTINAARLGIATSAKIIQATTQKLNITYITANKW